MKIKLMFMMAIVFVFASCSKDQDLDEVYVPKGTRVIAGKTIVGTLGDTYNNGEKIGPHLHINLYDITTSKISTQYFIRYSD